MNHRITPLFTASSDHHVPETTAEYDRQRPARLDGASTIVQYDERVIVTKRFRSIVSAVIVIVSGFIANHLACYTKSATYQWPLLLTVFGGGQL